MLTISVTGHRPSKLGGYAPCEQHRVIRRHMRDLLQKLQKEYGELTLFSGGANGIDQWWMAVGHYLEIPVIAIIPFKGYERLWPEEGQKYYNSLLDRCHEIRYTISTEVLTKKAAADANKQRNKDLVHACDLMVAYWDGAQGGTAHAVGYAKELKKDLLIFNPNDKILFPDSIGDRL